MDITCKSTLTFKKSLSHPATTTKQRNSKDVFNSNLERRRLSHEMLEISNSPGPNITKRRRESPLSGHPAICINEILPCDDCLAVRKAKIPRMDSSIPNTMEVSRRLSGEIMGEDGDSSSDGELEDVDDEEEEDMRRLRQEISEVNSEKDAIGDDSLLLRARIKELEQRRDQYEALCKLLSGDSQRYYYGRV